MPTLKKQGPNWAQIALVVGDTLRGLAGRDPIYGPMMLREQMERDQEDREYKRKLMEPRTVGDSLIVPDGNGGYKAAYSAPSPAESYAAAQGFQPGTPEYSQAVQDYVLKGYSPTGVAAKEAVTGYRYDRSDAQLGQRLQTMQRGQDLNYKARQAATAQSNTNNIRSTSTSSNNNVRSTSTSTANNIRSNQTSAANNALTNQTHLQTARHVRPMGNEPIAVGPNGEKMVVRNGQWVPAQ
jgi:hypothetical protein